MLPDSLQAIRFERDGAVATITLNRPDRLNAITPVMLEEMIAVLEACAGDPTVRIVVLTGAGRGFCAGGDLNSSGSTASTGRVETTVATSRRALRVSELLRSMPAPVIAAVNGPCAGAGLSWACAADLRIAADTATFVAAFTAAGVGGDHGISWLLPRIIGTGRAAELLLLSGRIDAEQAQRIGLVSRVVGADELIPAVAEWVARLLALAPGALAAMKANLRDAQTVSLGEALDREAERLVHAFRHPDSTEAAAAFLAKRAPSFGA
jgi:2-(1,2-epoxy-1,2-dihydrophenyl)acetyl-CoA isomerase